MEEYRSTLLIMTIKERLSLLQILPTQGSVSEMVDVYDLARELKLSDEEKGEVNYIELGDSIKWDFNKDPNKEIKLSKDQLKIVLNQIDELDKHKKVPLSMIELIIKLKEYGKYNETGTIHS